MKPHIIAGERKRIYLNVPESGTRPMTNRVKSALFSIIIDRIPSAYVLDVFAGSGALGLEMLSRGAQYAVFIEIADEAVHCISQNIEKTGYQDKTQIIQADAHEFLNNPGSFKLKQSRFDVIFICPPHKDISVEYISQSVSLLAPEGIIIAEFPHTRTLPTQIESLAQIDVRTYGKTSFAIYGQRT